MRVGKEKASIIARLGRCDSKIAARTTGVTVVLLTNEGAFSF
jgi:hypothetical protein